MRLTRLRSLLVALTVVSPACGDDDGAATIDAPADSAGADALDLDAEGADAAPPGASVGEACEMDEDCLGNTCLGTALGFPDGYCTEVGCDAQDLDSCAAFGGDGVCLMVDDVTSICFDACAAPGDCRSGYECLEVTALLSVCVPMAECGNGFVEGDEECEPPGVGNCGSDCLGTGTAVVGDACEGPEDCLGDTCISEADGWPAGYCTEFGCDLSMPDNSCNAFGGDGVCIDIGDPGTPVGACFDACDPSAPDCRSGYFCQPFGGGLCVPLPVCGDGVIDFPEECDPPSTATCGPDCVGTGSAAVGAACAGAGDCEGNVCITDFPMGYCSQVGCDLDAADTSCLAFGGDGVCFDIADPGQLPTGACFDTCDPAVSGDCRSGYLCTLAGVDLHVCLPAPVCGDGVVEFPEECDPPSSAGCSAGCVGTGTSAVGAACSDAADCAGDLCLTGDEGFPAGYCSDYDCDLGADPVTACAGAGGDGYCLDSGDGLGLCLDQCGGAAGTCRGGYACTSFAGGVRLCVP